MNDWKPLEIRLSSWKLRPPSARLKERLFPQEARGSSQDEDWTLADGLAWVRKSLARPWLAPVMAVFLLGMFLNGLTPEAGVRSVTYPSNSLASASILNGSALGIYLSEAAHSLHNNWQAATFEWTNGEASLTTSAPVSYTNSQIQ